MTQKAAYYRVMCGMPGYMPNSVELHSWPTRRDMAKGINYLLDIYGFSQRNRRQINLNEIWDYVQRGGKRGNFVIRGNMGNSCNLEFEQMQWAEWHKESEEQADY